MKMLDLGLDDRPREKLIKNGAHALSDSELIAVLLRTGSKELNAVDTARCLLQSAGQNNPTSEGGALSNLSDMTPEAMCRIKGIGPNKAATLAAAIELGKRCSEAAISAKTALKGTIKTPGDAARIFRGLIRQDRKEECWCLLLRRTKRVLGSLQISQGGETITDMDIKQIVRKALDTGASAVVIAHNHPSGDPRPSAADIKLTKKLQSALETFEIHLLDHIILSDTSWYSFSTEIITRI